MKAKAEALEFSVSEKDAEIELLHDRQERQHAQVHSELSLHTLALLLGLTTSLNTSLSNFWPASTLPLHTASYT